MSRKLSFITAAGALAVGAALVLSGCSSHASASASGTTKSSAPAQGQSGGAGGAQGGAGNGTIGQIAAISGSTLQVQSSSDQTAVNYTSSTALTQTVSVALSAVKVGECVTATTASAAGSTSSPSPSSSSGAVTSVSITQPSNGSCTGGFGGRGGASGTRPTNRPSFNPSDRPSNRPSGSRGGFGGGNFVLPTSGKVTAVSGSTITVDALDFQTQKTSAKTVTVGSSTKYTESESATSSALTVGKCVVARGSSDDSGNVTATSIAISAPVNGSCTTGFGGRGGFGGRNGGGTTGGQSGTSNG
ncbi:DUF5666 domain-containing protein [Gryllotalpicola reticulitermitis]|uniref:DUF5666 domain-containing protein n=1 Tax=Gryllotalpicola reticulitermitis TaxID=1184153 RepID=A0ABV8Q4P7_9MICO